MYQRTCTSKCTCWQFYVATGKYTCLSQLAQKSNYCPLCKIVHHYIHQSFHSIHCFRLHSVFDRSERNTKEPQEKKRAQHRSTVPINTSSGKTETIKLSPNWDSISERRFKRGMKNKKSLDHKQMQQLSKDKPKATSIAIFITFEIWKWHNNPNRISMGNTL